MKKIKKYILPTVLYGAALFALYFVYQTQVKVINQEVLTHDIDSDCDINIFSIGLLKIQSNKV